MRLSTSKGSPHDTGRNRACLYHSETPFIGPKHINRFFIHFCNSSPLLRVFIYAKGMYVVVLYCLNLGVLMEITENQESRIQEIMREMDCPKAFECYRSRFKNLGKVRGIGTNGFLECLSEDSQNCQFSLFSGNEVCCLCPVRIHIATEFKI